MKLYAAGALVLVIAIVLFPLWPLVLRQGVWYLSMGMLGLIGLFFGMAIVRLILFIITMFVKPPGLWLYPNLFEDVGFFDSFRPLWAWHEVRHTSQFPHDQHANEDTDTRRHQSQKSRQKGKESRKTSCQSLGKWSRTRTWSCKEEQEGWRVTSTWHCYARPGCRLSAAAHGLRSCVGGCGGAAAASTGDCGGGGGRVGRLRDKRERGV